MQSCPLCGAETQQRTSPKGVVFVGCSTYPKCKLYGTPETVNTLIHTLSEKSEWRQMASRLSDKVLAAGGEDVEKLPPVPLRIGEYIGDVAEVVIRRSRLKQERKDKDGRTQQTQGSHR